MKTIRVTLMVALVWLALPASVSAFYNPESGRWLSRDLVEEPTERNRYAFVQNATPNAFDFMGLAIIRSTGEGGGPEMKVYLGCLTCDSPDQWRVKPSPDVKTCCTKDEIVRGRQRLIEFFAEAKAELEKRKIQPLPYRAETADNTGASCINSSAEILASFYHDGLGRWRFPKCWRCRVEGRRGPLGIGQHAAIVCHSYSADNSVPNEDILFDWWGDVMNRDSNSGGSPKPFYSKYPNNSGKSAGTLWEPIAFSTCGGKFWQNEMGIPAFEPDPPNWEYLEWSR